jgi:hypothetical protein
MDDLVYSIGLHGSFFLGDRPGKTGIEQAPQCCLAKILRQVALLGPPHDGGGVKLPHAGVIIERRSERRLNREKTTASASLSRTASISRK